MPDVSHRCCAEFARATKDSTANEGYEALVFVSTDDGTTRIGSDLAPIAFCPWCAAPVQQPKR